MLRLLSIITLLLVSNGLMAAEPAHYITDDVYVYIHGGPGNQYRIIGSVEAGQAVTSLNETQDDYAKIIDHKGREGWVKSELITTTKSIRERLPDLQDMVNKAKDDLLQMTQTQASTAKALEDANKSISQLKQLLAKTEAQRDSIKQKASSVEDQQKFAMWQQGGIIGGIGALIGIILVYLPRPNGRKQNRWM
ncbi:TIGR04211 family SH3 domain-containing protein [Shewanella sp. SR44-3]|uniref:TIGR04211 family SH3 domain-containing protein n=1 Tax=Shewanella sp. TaxID=50422 RepID=UPI0015FC4A66|nr:TIGR04211 family SH3 domain-containing protein [Shewanella sp. SR44-3]